METEFERTMGKLNYDAYCVAREWKAFNGDPLPQWEKVTPEIQLAWIRGAKAVVLKFMAISGINISVDFSK